MTTWGTKNEKMGLTYDQLAMLILKEAGEAVKDSMEAMRDELVSDEEPKVTRVQNELFYFFVFGIDYWWQNDFRYTKEQKSIFEKIFSTHLDIMCGDDEDGRAMWETLQERFIAYGQIVNEEKSDSGKLVGFGIKLSEYCEIKSGTLVLLVPEIFMKAFKLVSAFKVKER